MAYDAVLADRIRDVLAGRPEGADVVERRMFGGLAFLVGGHLAVCASSTGDLMVRASREDWTAWTSGAGPDGDAVRPLEMRGRPMTGWLLVAVDAVAGEAALASWVGRGVEYAAALPSKP